MIPMIPMIPMAAIEPYRTYLIWIPPFSNLHYPLKSMGILSSINGGLFRQIEGPSTVNMSTFRREFFIGKTGLFVGDLETAKWFVWMEKNPTNNTDSVVLVDICQFVLLVVSTTRTQCVNVTWTYGTKFGASMDPHGCSQSFGPQTEVEISPTVMDLKTMFWWKQSYTYVYIYMYQVHT